MRKEPIDNSRFGRSWLPSRVLGVAAAICVALTPPLASQAPPPGPKYSIEGVRFGIGPEWRTASLVVGADPAERLDIAFIVWVIRGGGKTILFDAGFHRPELVKRDRLTEPSRPDEVFMKPDAAVQAIGIRPEDVTDLIISHVHYDHMGGIDLFPNATIWIQKNEYRYYTADAWQPGGRSGGVIPEDVQELVRRNTRKLVRLIDGDDQEFLPGIRAYTGARHTYASQFIRVAGAGQPTWVLASDNCYLYRNLDTGAPGLTFEPADRPANIAAQTRMVSLAGSAERVLPGHDMLIFKKFPATGRVVRIQ
jgi:glyoxylase-like metal-dependent hydrolase (beta-lactamase superfamily II)